MGPNQTYKCVCTAKETIYVFFKKTRLPTEWKNIVANDGNNKVLISKTYQQLNNNNNNNKKQLKNGQNT